MPDATRELVGPASACSPRRRPRPTCRGCGSCGPTGGSGLVQVAEQYLLMPGHAARLAMVREGVIGEATSVQISSTHLYHAVSMIRGLLGVGFEPAGCRPGRSPRRWPTRSAPTAGPATHAARTSTTLATLDFGGRMGLYDFTDNQWWNPLRSRRIVVRGSLGELVDDRVVRLVDPETPVESHLVRRQTGIDLNLEGVELDHISFDGRVVYRNAFTGTRLSEDDIAVAACWGEPVRGRAAGAPSPTRWPRPAGPPDQPGDRGGGGDRHCGDHHDRGVGRLSRRYASGR